MFFFLNSHSRSEVHSESDVFMCNDLVFASSNYPKSINNNLIEKYTNTVAEYYGSSNSINGNWLKVI